MKCANHEKKEAVGACVHCGRGICEECCMDVQGKFYCKKCLNEIVTQKNKICDLLKGVPINKITEQNILAAICYLWIIGPIIFFFKRDNEYVLFHARQGTVLFACSILAMIIRIIPFVFWLGSLLMGLIFIFCLIGFIAALFGHAWRMPVIGEFAEKLRIESSEE